METCLLLSARRYSFRDDAARQVEGVTLSYLTGEREEGQDRRGLEPLTITGGLEVFSGLQEVPGLYEMGFRQRPGKNGRPTLQVVSVRYVGPSMIGEELAQPTK